MSKVRRIGDAYTRNVEAALELMLKKTREGRLPSLIIIGEEMGSTVPVFGVVGRYRADPARAIGHVAVMKRKLVAWAADQAPDIEDR